MSGKSDYIRREDAIMAAMDYNGCGNAQDASQDIAADLASIPAADVVEVVRCKDCKFYDESIHFCELYKVKHPESFYCYDGTRCDPDVV